MVGSGARIFLALLALAAVGTGFVVFVGLPDRDEVSLESDAGPVDDASVDAHASAAKKKPAKKKAVRGGKTQVAGRSGGTGGAHGGGGHARANGSGKGPAAHGAVKGGHAPPSGPSYESMLDSNDQQLTIGGPHAGPDLTDAQLSAPMSDGSFISECGAPDDMSVTVKVAIKKGHAVGVSVSTNPPAPAVAGCIDHHVRGLSWPSSPKMDSLVTSY